jgi:pimeloyl-ACP methyl ester carboxylesterase
MPSPESRELQEKTFQCRATSLHYAEGPANGPPLVLLHGTSRDHSSFSALYPDLVVRFHIFALDLRGHGGSGRVKDGYRIVDMAEDIAEFLSTAIPSPAAVFGHSLGGMIGMCAAADHANVSALIAGDSMLTPSNLSAMYDAIFSQLHGLLLGSKSLEELASGIGRIQIHFPGIREAIHLDEIPGNTSNNLLVWARTAIRTDPECLRMTVDRSAYAGWNPEKILPRITCPVLLLQANPELDALLSDADLALAKRLLPRAEHVQFPLLGHALFMQQPKPVLNAMIGFLARSARR